MVVHAGDTVRLVSRHGRVVEGTVEMWWPVKSGGLCIRVKPGTGPRVALVCTTVELVSCEHRKAS